MIVKFVFLLPKANQNSVWFSDPLLLRALPKIWISARNQGRRPPCQRRTAPRGGATPNLQHLTNITLTTAAINWTQHPYRTPPHGSALARLIVQPQHARGSARSRLKRSPGSFSRRHSPHLPRRWPGSVPSRNTSGPLPAMASRPKLQIQPATVPPPLCRDIPQSRSPVRPAPS